MRLSRVPCRFPVSATPLLVLLALTGCKGGTDAQDSAACPETTWSDVDQDGYVSPSGDSDCAATAEDDCDDSDPNVHPDAAEVPSNGQDDDCDGEIDEGATNSSTDQDGDGYSVDEGDCDDTSSAVNPDATEVCDGVDNNCDGGVDEGATDMTTWYTDGDGDGVGDVASAVQACDAPAGTVALGDDCDDSDARFYPGAAETDCADPNDYNCDDSTGYADADADGFAACQECDDNNGAVNPDATDVCDGVDNNCDTSVDEGLLTTYYGDADGDGYGDAAVTQDACEVPEGYSATSGDTDDTNSTVYPGSWAKDDDGDGYSEEENDCDDNDPNVYPGATETPYDGVDDDCEDGDLVDVDGDGYDATSAGGDDPDDTDAAIYLGSPAYDDDGDTFTEDGGDCDDADPAVYPGATETPYDGVDDDCEDGDLVDVDGDGYDATSAGGDDPDDNDATIFLGSSAYDDDKDGYSEDQGDTDDTDPLEVPTKDDDKDGFSPLDGDCDDDAETVYPGALEACDEQDNDCDGSTDEDSSVIWFPASGGSVDYTADLAAGTSSAPAALSFSAKGTLYVCPGTWYAHLSSSRDLSIIGIDEGGTILNGGGKGRVVTASSTADLTLTKLTITGGDASTASPAGYGGGVFIQYGDATLDEVTLSFNKAGRGGGIGTDSVGDGVMTNVTLFGNEATYGGGAHLATATVNSTTFEDNVASSGYGGGLYATFVEIENSTFTNNSATGSGGAAYIYSGTITGTTFDSNLATTFGGALSQYSGNLEVSSSAFTDNTAGSGGAVYSNSSTLMLDAVEMTDNSATSGAGLYAQSTGVSITGSTISTNRASVFGGGVYGLYSNIEVEDSDVSGNKAGYGGAFFMDTYSGAASSLILGVDTVLSYNTATYYGGAILSSLQEGQLGSLEIIIDGASINNNQAQRGGAIATGWYYGSSPSRAVITCTSGDIVDNTASMGIGDGAHLHFGTGETSFSSLVSTGCVWGSDQELYVANLPAAYLPSSLPSSFTCTSAGCF